MTSSSLWPRILRELPFVASLMLVVGIAWCFGTGIRSITDLRVPTAYNDFVKADVIDQLAHIKAARDGHFTPVLQKVIPELGAPIQADWSDWPLVEEVPFLLLGKVAWFTDIFAALQLGLLANHLLAALGLYGVARHQGASRAWAWAGGLAFGLAPFLFMQSPHHLGAVVCWHIPLFIPVWKWVSRDGGLAPRSREFVAALVIGGITGTLCVYFTLVFCQIVLLAALIGFARTRNWQGLFCAAGVIGATALGFAVMNADTWAYRLQHGPNPLAVLRDYRWLEMYGLKVVDLLIPPVDHWVPALGEYARRHAGRTMLIDEGSYLGVAGLLCLLGLAAVAGHAVIMRRFERFPAEAWQLLWILAFFTTGGLNLLLGAAGFNLFRANCRLSIVMLAVVWVFAAVRLSRHGLPWRIPGWSVALFASLLIVFDQTPRPPSLEARDTVRRTMDSDRAFVAAIEGAVPPGTMVFQAPVMDYPEAPIPGLPAYDLLRPYLHSSSLRFSAGAIRGRSFNPEWRRLESERSLSAFAELLRDYGFGAIIIHRKAYEDRGEFIVSQLRQSGSFRRIDDQVGDFVCVVLK